MRRREPLYLSSIEQSVFAQALTSRPRIPVLNTKSEKGDTELGLPHKRAQQLTPTGRPRAVPLADEPRIAQQARQLLSEGYKIHEIAHVIGLSVSAKTIRRYMSRHPAPPDTMWDFDVEESPG